MFARLKRFYRRRVANTNAYTPREARSAWVAALRSGQYRQCSSLLCSVDLLTGEPVGYCCLGVACELYRSLEWRPLTIRQVNKAREYQDGDEKFRSGVLPDVVRQWLGLRTNGGDFGGELNSDASLTALNDLARKSFAEIADVIESEPQGLLS